MKIAGHPGPEYQRLGTEQLERLRAWRTLRPVPQRASHAVSAARPLNRRGSLRTENASHPRRERPARVVWACRRGSSRRAGKSPTKSSKDFRIVEAVAKSTTLHVTGAALRHDVRVKDPSHVPLRGAVRRTDDFPPSIRVTYDWTRPFVRPWRRFRSFEHAGARAFMYARTCGGKDPLQFLLDHLVSRRKSRGRSRIRAPRLRRGLEVVAIVPAGKAFRRAVPRLAATATTATPTCHVVEVKTNAMRGVDRVVCAVDCGAV